MKGSFDPPKVENHWPRCPSLYLLVTSRVAIHTFSSLRHSFVYLADLTLSLLVIPDLKFLPGCLRLLQLLAPPSSARWPKGDLSEHALWAHIHCAHTEMESSFPSDSRWWFEKGITLWFCYWDDYNGVFANYYDSRLLSDKGFGEKDICPGTEAWMIFLPHGYGQCCVGVHACDLR